MRVEQTSGRRFARSPRYESELRFAVATHETPQGNLGGFVRSVPISWSLKALFLDRHRAAGCPGICGGKCPGKLRCPHPLICMLGLPCGRGQGGRQGAGGWAGSAGLLWPSANRPLAAHVPARRWQTGCLSSSNPMAGYSAWVWAPDQSSLQGPPWLPRQGNSRSLPTTGNGSPVRTLQR
jgi:hypothetical protein